MSFLIPKETCKYDFAYKQTIFLLYHILFIPLPRKSNYDLFNTK